MGGTMYNVLIVDDELLEREGLKDLIRMLGLPFYVRLASDGEVALNHLQSHPDTDILITDIKMSFRDGLSLIDEAHRLNPELPVIIFSAYDKFDYARQAIALNVTDYLLKPIEPDLFLASMQKAIQRCEQNRKKQAGRVPAASQPFKREEDPTIRMIRSIIENEYNRDLSLEYIAEKCNRTPSYLSNLFSFKTSQTIIQYLRDFRMKKAEELLKNTNMKVADIAATVGYDNPNYFNKLFQSIYHMASGDYRKENRMI